MARIAPGSVRRIAQSAISALALCALAAWISGCGGPGSRKPETESREDAPHALKPPEATAATSRKFEEPGELDRTLDAKPMDLPAVKPASQVVAAAAARTGETSKSRGNFRIQIGAEADVDAAQAKKAKYEKMLGGSVDMVFDAPYYKLRWGYFDSKQEAEDKILELSDLKIQGFVVKQ